MSTSPSNPNPTPQPGSGKQDPATQVGSTPVPRPGPKPGPRPGATPAALAAKRRTPAPLPQHTPNDPKKWGRIDEDGTVYVRTAEGERAIGSWQAGTPEEGLAHYGTRFEDLATEVELLESRLKAHPAEAAAIRKSAETLQESLPTATAIGDLAGLAQRLDTVINHSETTNEQVKEEKARRREAAIAEKEQLAVEAEELAENATNWKEAGDRIQVILEKWKAIRGIDRKTDDSLWKRYSRARDAFNRRRGAHFAELDRGRVQAKRVKEELVERAEALQDSTDWTDTARAYRDLMQEWKAAGRAPREVDDKLWARFRAAQDHFFDARSAVNDERDREFATNAEAKDALLAEYSPLIDPEKDLDRARAKLAELQEKWEGIGFVPRNRISEYENKIGELEQRVVDAADAQWRRTDPAAQARAAQFTAKVVEFTEAAEAAEAKGKAKQAEKFRAQAAQWQEWADTALNAVEQR
ncbi:hypothetical protein COCCU_08500 [Corynebacterium occultum]|uniref:DNA repair ATPase n=1 Tax=Corynebacterium occultum TaxID=2675219 RepID=A0A6B8W2A3_9CORY|nr:DUF349 domain-containing protein [Corynebacterium occultum]QGU07624.1 hypothetical protein COCCU_08500 [Corynebacterium occultum]